MRDIALVLAILGGLGLTFRWPFVGILLWTWFTCMQPHQETYGFAQTAPLNLIIATVTIFMWFVSKGRKLPRGDATFYLILTFLVWMTINTVVAVRPEVSWPIWDRTWKTFALGLFIGAMATNKIRIHAIIWVIVISLFYYGLKGGLFTLITGGRNHVLGPADSIIGDNNQLALALLMVLPLANYLRMHSANTWIRRGLLVSMAFTSISVLGSYSRGAYLALGGLSLVAWFRVRNKFIYPIVAAAVLLPALYFMPQSFYDRMNTIESANADVSFQGRVIAWKVAFDFAKDHFPFGAGFYGPQQPEVFNHYAPGEATHAAHSIFFEVMGDNGFLGFTLYMLLLVLAFLNTVKIRRATCNRRNLRWARDLATMIQLSLFVFCLGGAALSMAYYDIFIIYLGLLPALRVLVSESKAQDEIRDASAALPFVATRPNDTLEKNEI